jgi:hypothetical protein
MGYYHVISCTMYAARDGLRWQGAPKSIGSTRCSQSLCPSVICVFSRFFGSLVSKSSTPKRLMIDVTL